MEECCWNFYELATREINVERSIVQFISVVVLLLLAKKFKGSSDDMTCHILWFYLQDHWI